MKVGHGTKKVENHCSSALMAVIGRSFETTVGDVLHILKESKRLALISKDKLLQVTSFKKYNNGDEDEPQR